MCQDDDGDDDDDDDDDDEHCHCQYLPYKSNQVSLPDLYSPRHPNANMSARDSEGKVTAVVSDFFFLFLDHGQGTSADKHGWQRPFPDKDSGWGFRVVYSTRR